MLTLAGPRRPTRALAFCPRTGRLAAAGDDRVVRLWQPPAAEPAVTSAVWRGPLSVLAFHPAGDGIAAGTRTGSFARWDLSVAAPTPLGWVNGSAACVAYTAAGGTVLGAARVAPDVTSSARVFCLDPPAARASIPWGGDLESAAYCPARDLFALAVPDRSVELFEPLRPRRDPVARMPARVAALAFSADGRRLACTAGRVVEVLDLDRPSAVRCVGHRAIIEALAFAPGGRSLLSGGGDGVRLWDALSGRQLAAWDWGLGAVFAVAFAPDGMTAAAAGRKPGVVIWDIDEG